MLDVIYDYFNIMKYSYQIGYGLFISLLFFIFLGTLRFNTNLAIFGTLTWLIFNCLLNYKNAKENDFLDIV